MFLKRIDVLGFKSFADKTAVEFSPGITAVVGPNGSGKSNIADAIRWVLGEQSARSLRGSKMEDVIFAGSETRRPINFCEVSLTLDNFDRHLPVVYDEVTVTRRVYRSGESEYMMNRQACRLKDIAELFMDSGLGRESYSIIGQGRIEEMLSTRPEDRRGPFEDAAGIVKYKFRKKEAERKLEETAVNLLRVDDILAELERQAGPLEKEAEKAAQYRKTAEELKQLDISLLVKGIEQLQERFSLASENVEQLAGVRQSALDELGVRDELLKQARFAFEEQTRAMETLQKQLMEKVEDRQRTEGQIALFSERLQNLESTLQDRAGQLDQVGQETQQLSEQFEEQTNRLTNVTAKLEAKNAELEVAAYAVDPAVRAGIEQEIDAYNSELIEAHHEAATLRNEIKVAEESMLNDDRKRERFQAERVQWEGQIAALQEKSVRLEQERADLQQALASAQSELDEKAKILRQRLDEEAAVVMELHQTESSLASLVSRAELLKDLEEGYDGYALGVRTVLQAGSKGRLEGIHGSVASLMFVPKKYETAIEIALGASLQNVVVSTEKDARDAIAMLKHRQAGRATFIPLSVIKSRLLGSAEVNKVSHHSGFIGVASQLVECDAQYRTLVESLLGNVVVANKLLDANELARLLNYRVRIVTLEGDVVSPGGIMSGGSHARKGPGLLGRTREQSDVQAQIEQTNAKKQQLTQDKERLRTEISSLQQEQNSILKANQEAGRKLNEVQASLRENNAQLASTKERLGSLEWEWQQLQSGQSAWQNRVQESKARLVEVEQTLAEIENHLVEQRKKLETWDRTIQQAQESLTKQKVEVATLTQEQTALRQRTQEIKMQLQRYRERQLQLNTDREEFVRNLETTKVQKGQAQEKLIEVTFQADELQSRLTTLQESRRQAEADAAVKERNFREHQQVLTRAEEQLHRAQVAAERTDMELTHALNRMGETYHMTYEWARDHYPAPEDADAVRRLADELRRQIKALGDVQLSAIEEWDRLSERMRFLKSEQDDLVQAREQLLDVISEIDEEMSRRFSETFAQIRTEFQVAFRALFNGGRADLELTAPDDMLHTGIEVIAQPPGKRLQNLNLLSGGERALTAMALLFAILRVRPVPFCVLDEVEAALDEANVGRFAQYVRKFAGETQFIVITHRRGTMEEADVLYGVTMQESGVSSLIAVRLSDDLDFETA
ncbi:chromosome segregation protein SMC [Alicyclobacillus tolerans]|uniref:chromosome segregation protein SMC n=1 Tax=Alicyclobacillus tolerans TaxID=90970 RepID=UPI001EFFF05A|nr:chromosome segregation protein SMC [Alicyclobacillus tolerans]MCF8564393.1 chromosome segregation protein SMC [Alicyclobacillus tolerans]